MRKRFLSTVIILVSSLHPVLSLAQWVQTNGPQGGTISAFLVKGDSIFAGTEHGLYLRSNVYARWEFVGLNDLRVTSLAIHGGYLYAGTSAKGLFRSQDSGETWVQVNFGLPDQYVYTLASSDTTLFAGTSYGIIRSTDHGESWVILARDTISYVLSILVTKDKILVGTWSGGIYASTDQGASWIHSNAGMGNRYTATLVSSDTTIYAGAFGGVFRSTDDGANWVDISDGLYYNDVYSLIVIRDTILAGTGGSGIYRSSDGGSSWVPINNGISASNAVISLALADSNIIAGTFARGVYLSDDAGMSWRTLNDGILDVTVPALAMINNTLIAGAESAGMFFSSDDGDNWIKVAVGSYPYISVLSVLAVGDSIFAGTSPGGVYFSSDKGESWTERGLSYLFVYSLAQSNSTLFAAAHEQFNCFGGGGIYRSTDNGLSWEQVLKAACGYIAVAAHDRYLFGSSGYFVSFSSDGGDNWTHIKSGLPDTLFINSLLIEDSNAFAGTSRGIYRIHIEDTSWIEANIGIPLQTEVYTLKSAAGMLLAGTNQGVFASSNRGDNWTAVNEGLPENIVVRSLLTDCQYFYAGTVGRGAWRRPLTEVNPSGGPLTQEGWNLISVYQIMDDYRLLSLFPCSVSKAFRFENEYVAIDTLQNGRGYWLKFSSQTLLSSVGIPITIDTFDVDARWNMIGSISNPVSVSTIGSIPPGLIVSQFYTYQVDSGNYVVSDTIEPGKGYWVKVNQSGKLILSSSSNIPAMNRIDIVPIAELPPPPPGEHPTGGRETPKIPTQFALVQNYPNPFNPTTIIKYSIPRRSHVSLKVFDVLGREATTLVNEEKNAGEFSVIFDVKNLPSGIYIYRLIGGSFIQQKKMLVLK